ERRRNRPREERPVVARVVPGKAAFVEAVLPEADRVFDRFERRLAVEDHGLAVLLDLHAAERPEERIPERRRIAEAVAERLAERMAVGLQLLSHGPVFVPGLGKLVDASLGEPRLAIGVLGAEDVTWHAEPFAVVRDDAQL